jgi:hypothetical protein
MLHSLNAKLSFISMSMSIEDATKVLEDRIRFKLYAAQYYLKQLKDLESRGQTPHDPRDRILWEMTSENLLFHLVGALDALLRRITERYDVKIDTPRDFTIKKIYRKLGLKQGLIKEAYDLVDSNLNRDGSWLTVLFNLRNTGMHRAILNLGFSANSKEVSFVSVREPAAAIPYLEKAIKQMKDLITGIVNKDTSLRTS